MQMIGEGVPSKENYYALANSICEVFFDPTASEEDVFQRLSPLMTQLCRLVSIDHAHSYFRQAASRAEAPDVHAED